MLKNRIPNYYNFKLNESIVTLSNDLIIILNDIKPLVSEEESDWITNIIDKSGYDIELLKYDNNKDYLFDIIDDIKDRDYLLMNSVKDGRKSKIKIGKALKIITPNIPDHILSNIVAAIKKNNDLEIKEVVGEEIADYYNFDKIHMAGTLGNSCMNRKNRDYYDIYVKNPEIVKLVVILDSDGYLVARSLVWNIEKDIWILDRIYYTNNKYEYEIKRWSKSNNYFLLSDIKKFNIEIKLKEFNFDKYPYLDTFSFLSLDEGILSNENIFSGENVIELNNTDGTFNYVNVFLEVHDIDIYKHAENLKLFIELSINFEDFLSDFISNEVELYFNERQDFTNVYSYLIISHLNLNNKDIDDDKLEKIILDLPEHEYNELVETLIKEQFSEYKDFNDLNDEFLFVEDELSYFSLNVYQKRYIDSIIRDYCHLNILNENLSNIYINDPEYYSFVMSSIGGHF